LSQGLVSLWDMLNFHLIGVVHVLWMLDFYEKSRPQNTGLLAAIGGPSSSNEISEMAKDNGRGIIKEATELAGIDRTPSPVHQRQAFERLRSVRHIPGWFFGPS
jgi:hypothetical protein